MNRLHFQGYDSTKKELLYQFDYMKNFLKIYLANRSDQDGRGVRRGANLLPQIHQKYIDMWIDSQGASTERWHKTSDFQKGKEIST